MSIAANFDDKTFSTASVSADGDQLHFGHSHHEGATGDVVVVPDAHLLFSGSYSRAGVDLVLTDASQKYVVHDYFKGDKHPILSSRDGATLSPAIVDALTGHTAYAEEAASPPAGQVIGHVLKLSGSASVIRNGVTVELGIGDAVMKGDVVQTGSDSSIGMTFIDGSAFGMTSNARMVLNDMVYSETGSSNSSLISLVQGTITFVAGQTAKNGNMKVETPVATMGIRGTAVLVEIDSNDGPTKFSVLVEPDGHTGSYNLYNKVTGDLIGSVSQSGQVTFVSALGDQSSLTTVPQSQADQDAQKAIIQQVFQLYFPNYNPDSSPKSNKRGDAGSSTNNLAQITSGQLQPDGPGTPPSTIQVKVPHTDPVTGETTYITVFKPSTGKAAQFSAISETELQDGTSAGNPNGPDARGFFIKDHVIIVDPDTGGVIVSATPFVTGSGKITGVTGDIPASVTAAFLEGLIQIDQSTGYVTFAHGVYDFLGDGQSLVFALVFSSNSGSNIATQTLSFTVKGTNDLPVISGVSAGSIAEPAQYANNAHSMASGSLKLSDIDQNDNITVTTAFDHFAYTDANGHTISAQGSILTAIQSLELKLAFDESVSGNQGTLSWTFETLDSALDFLGQGETLQLTYTVSVSDGHGGTTTQPVVITLVGTNDLPVISGVSSGAIVEKSYHSHGHDAAGGLLILSDIDHNDSITVTTAFDHFVYTDACGDTICPQGGILKAIESLESKLVFTENVSGNQGSVSWTFDAKDSALDFLAQGETLQLTYLVSVSDGHGGTTTQPVVVTLVGTNDKPDLKSVHAGTLVDTANYDEFCDLRGHLQGHDVDHGDQQTLTYGVLENGHITNGCVEGEFGTLTVSANGDYTYNPNSAAINALQCGQYQDVFYIETTDGHGATDVAKFIVNVAGSNDDPVIAGNLTACTVEGDCHFSTNLLAGASDVDQGTKLYISDVSYQIDGNCASSEAPTGLSLCGSTLTVDPSNPAFDHLSAGQTETIIVSYNIEDGHGGSVAQHETVTVAGVNDAPVLNTANVHESESLGSFGFTHTFSFNGFVGSDVDDDSGCSDYTLTLSASDGVLSLPGCQDGLDVDQGHHSLTITGTLTDINDALAAGSNGFSYTVSSFETGVEKITATLTDSHHASDTVNFIFRQDALSLLPATLNGTTGNDVFFSSAGNDKMVSKGGDDQFVFNGHFGHDTIVGFNQNSDAITINGTVQSISDLLANAHTIGSDTLITFAHDPFDSILLKDVHLHQTNPGVV